MQNLAFVIMITLFSVCSRALFAVEQEGSFIPDIAQCVNRKFHQFILVTDAHVALLIDVTKYLITYTALIQQGSYSLFFFHLKNHSGIFRKEYLDKIFFLRRKIKRHSRFGLSKTHLKQSSYESSFGYVVACQY